MGNEYLFFLQREYMHVCIFFIYIDMDIQKYLDSSIHMNMHVYMFFHKCICSCICIRLHIWMYTHSCNSGRL